MKTLVLYHSFGGNTRHVAGAVAQSLGADLAEVQPSKSLRWLGPLVYLVGGFQAIKGKTPELKPLDKNPADYDLIVIGTPVWAGRCTPPICSVLKQMIPAGKKVALFAVSASGKSNTLDQVKTVLPECDIMGSTDIQVRNKKQWEEAGRQAVGWAQKIQTSM